MNTRNSSHQAFSDPKMNEAQSNSNGDYRNSLYLAIQPKERDGDTVNALSLCYVPSSASRAKRREN